MSKIDENGNIQQYKIPPHITIYAHTKKFAMRFIANVDAFCWMLRRRR